ncbi:hypothetical protein ABZT34_30425 [Streptomyces sp. NPDC005329]|uniref:hypothetical protein n=1 Tax=Streptomyces sp. NPDC005329 TaxID=3157034 RepID=UPI0033BC7D2C
MTADGTVDCCDGFVSHGRMSFTNSTIASTLCLAETTNTDRPTLLSLRAGSIRTTACQFHGPIDLRPAQIDVLTDTPAKWPDKTSLDGLPYTHLETGPLDGCLADSTAPATTTCLTPTNSSPPSTQAKDATPTPAKFS